MAAVHLPREDIVWVIRKVDDQEVEDSDDEDKTVVRRLVTIVDTRGAMVAASLKAPQCAGLASHVEETLKDAIITPLSGKPRRPAYVSFKDCPSLDVDVLTRMGVQPDSATPRCDCEPSPLPTETSRACNVCGRRGDSPLFTACPMCLAVYYCSEKCRQEDLYHHHDSHSHAIWCQRMKTYVANSDRLADLPFTYIQESTAESFTREQLKHFLQGHHVFGQGLWRRVLPPLCPNHMPIFGELSDVACPYVLQDEGLLLSCPPPVPRPPALSTWATYYSWRGINLSSPIAAILTYPLTIFHVIACLLQTNYPNCGITPDTPNLTIHVLGVEKEADMVDVFSELGYLLPNVNIDLVLIGPAVSKKVSGKLVQIRNVQITLQKGLYHKLHLTKPDLVIGFNAGLAAYSVWMDTLKKLKGADVPAFFTDYCRYSCECGRAPVTGLQVGTLSDIMINPFRSPFRKYCEEHAMPWYSNGFIYSLNYSPSS